MKGAFRRLSRSLGTSPLLAIAGIVSLGLGLGATGAVLTIADSLLYAPLPVSHARRLALVGSADDDNLFFTGRSWQDLQSAHVFTSAFAWSDDRVDVSETAVAEYADVIWASGQFFDTLGVPMRLGRPLDARDDQPSGGSDGAAVVISHRYWQRRFLGGMDVVGKTINAQGIPVTVVGVTHPKFFGPEVGLGFDIVLPLGLEPLVKGSATVLKSNNSQWLRVIARLDPGESVDMATSRLRSIQAHLRNVSAAAGQGSRVQSSYLAAPFVAYSTPNGVSALRLRYRTPVEIFAGIVLLVLIIACTNIACLFVVRSVDRSPELALRSALGASQGELARLVFVECLTWCVLGAVVGIVVKYWCTSLLLQQLSTPTYQLVLNVQDNWRTVLGNTAVLGLAVLATAAAPTLAAGRGDKWRHLSSRVAASRLSADAAVVLQVALASSLLTVTVLSIQNVRGLFGPALGFEHRNLLVAEFAGNRGGAKEEAVASYRRLSSAVEPSDLEVVASAVTPMGSRGLTARIGGADTARHSPAVDLNVVSPGWFAAYRVPLMAGRECTEGDASGASSVAIVNEAYRRRFLGAGSPLGATVAWSHGQSQTHEARVVGVAPDIPYRIGRKGEPMLYVCLLQALGALQQYRYSVSARSAGLLGAEAAKSFSDALSTTYPGVSFTFTRMSDRVRSAYASERAVAVMAFGLSCVAVVLVVGGIWALVAYSVSKRGRETAVRIALGATTFSVCRLLLARTVIFAGVGLLIGSAITIVTVLKLRQVLNASEGEAVMTFVACGVLLLAVVLAAASIPVRATLLQDPAATLKVN